MSIREYISPGPLYSSTLDKLKYERAKTQHLLEKEFPIKELKKNNNKKKTNLQKFQRHGPYISRNWTKN